MTINQMMERIQGETQGRAETENSNDEPKSKRADKRDSGMEMKQTCLIQEMKTLKIEEPKTRAWDIAQFLKEVDLETENETERSEKGNKKKRQTQLKNILPKQNAKQSLNKEKKQYYKK